ncbi:hypothetical protein [Xenorhabdus lircayensis]|uniref:Uncharacterized protein n=1 Tax=Xenorhabdus lircayensis TaxID=2763499 RepID=A0ABS0U516_9GAMM|nr:hypothetical protein [Xenorhabdus lircayensis]MBI6548063.1 hypothetical protein [Xenorhabdus lircayensis]
MTSLRSVAQAMKMRLAVIFSSWDSGRVNIGLMDSIVMGDGSWVIVIT